jgi:hypothetical protein
VAAAHREGTASRRARPGPCSGAGRGRSHPGDRRPRRARPLRGLPRPRGDRRPSGIRPTRPGSAARATSSPASAPTASALQRPPAAPTPPRERTPTWRRDDAGHEPNTTSERPKARERARGPWTWWRTQESHLARRLKCASPVGVTTVTQRRRRRQGIPRKSDQSLPPSSTACGRGCGMRE